MKKPKAFENKPLAKLAGRAVAPTPAPLRPEKQEPVPPISSDDDRERDWKRDVTPLSGRTVADPRRDTTAENQASTRFRALVAEGVRFVFSNNGRSGRRQDVVSSLFDRLATGALPIDATLDLHGLRVAAAETALRSFLDTSRRKGDRCVRVVCGRGQHSPDGLGILGLEIIEWLSRKPDTSVHVAAFSEARKHDGGDGAFYVLLRL